MEHGAWSMGMEHGAWSMVHGAWGMGHPSSAVPGLGPLATRRISRGLAESPTEGQHLRDGAGCVERDGKLWAQGNGAEFEYGTHGCRLYEREQRWMLEIQVAQQVNASPLVDQRDHTHTNLRPSSNR